MNTTYQTTVIGNGNHASIVIPNKNLQELGTHKRAPLRVTVNNHTYQSTATGVEGKCMVVFPLKDRESAGVATGDLITVALELDSGYRNVEIPNELMISLKTNNLTETFSDLPYSKRKDFSRQVKDAKAAETKKRRVEKIIALLKS